MLVRRIPDLLLALVGDAGCSAQPETAAAITVVVALAIAVPVTHDAYTGAAATASRGADPSLHVRQIVASFRFPPGRAGTRIVTGRTSCLQGSVRGESGAGALVPWKGAIPPGTRRLQPGQRTRWALRTLPCNIGTAALVSQESSRQASAPAREVTEALLPRIKIRVSRSMGSRLPSRTTVAMRTATSGATAPRGD